MTHPPKGGILILAAGSSTRFGDDKRLARLSDGSTLLERSVNNALKTTLPCVLCLPEHYPDPLPAVTCAELTVHRAIESHRGMGATLASGIRVVPDWDFVLVALADMPWVRVETFTAVASAAGSAGKAGKEFIVIPSHAGRRGHPVAFGAGFFKRLRELDGDQGGRDIVAAHPDAVHELPVNDPGILMDVDTHADLEQSVTR